MRPEPLPRELEDIRAAVEKRGRATAKDVGGDLPNVPKATLHRRLRALVDEGVLGESSTYYYRPGKPGRAPRIFTIKANPPTPAA